MLPLGKLSGCLGRWAKDCAKIQLCGSGSDERTPKKGMNMMKVNEMKHTTMQFMRRGKYYTISGLLQKG